MEVDTTFFGDAFLQRGQDDCTIVYTPRIEGRMDGAMYLGQQPPSLRKSIENGSWLGVPAWQKPETHSQGYSGVHKKHLNVLEWASQSPDLNPIKNLWRELKVLTSDSSKTWRNWRRSVWRSGPKSPLQCVQTWSRATGNIWSQLLQTKVSVLFFWCIKY